MCLVLSSIPSPSKPVFHVTNLSALLPYWNRHCSRKELESLIGTLHHGCKVIPQGRTFIRRMINLLSTFRRDNHPIRLNQEFSWTFLGGVSSSFLGMDLIFYSPPHGHLYLISRCYPTQLKLLAMVQFLAMTGLWENGPLLNNLCQ